MRGLRAGVAPRTASATPPARPNSEPAAGPGADESGPDVTGYRPDDGAANAAEADGPGPGGPHPRAAGIGPAGDPGDPRPRTGGIGPGGHPGDPRPRTGWVGPGGEPGDPHPQADRSGPAGEPDNPRPWADAVGPAGEPGNPHPRTDQIGPAGESANRRPRTGGIGPAGEPDNPRPWADAVGPAGEPGNPHPQADRSGPAGKSGNRRPRTGGIGPAGEPDNPHPWADAVGPAGDLGNPHPQADRSGPAGKSGNRRPRTGGIGPGGEPDNPRPWADAVGPAGDPGNPHPQADRIGPSGEPGDRRPRAGGIGRQWDGGPVLRGSGTRPVSGSASGLRSVLPGADTRTHGAPVGDAGDGGEGTVDGTWSADPYARALRTGRGPLFLRRADGWLLPLELERWCAAADAADLEVLRRCEGAVLDVGCGPGRLVAALGARGRRVLGIDVSEAAVARTVALGGQALRRSVFETLPGEGRWGTALLIDGNIGIGGDPTALLDRTAQLLAPGGLLIAETVTDPDLDERVRVHVTDARGAVGDPFPWARLGTPALLRHAARAGWAPVDQWTAGGRSFVALRRRTTRTTAEPPKSTAVTSSQRARKPSGDSPVAEA
ncbi:SAM-dependent methyltransferase [Streptomyces sp. SAI-208]|nr:SAM-dependent methyltransferase [Streptomyces sp. SAI-208]